MLCVCFALKRLASVVLSWEENKQRSFVRNIIILYKNLYIYLGVLPGRGLIILHLIYILQQLLRRGVHSLYYHNTRVVLVVWVVHWAQVGCLFWERKKNHKLIKSSKKIFFNFISIEISNLQMLKNATHHSPIICVKSFSA